MPVVPCYLAVQGVQIVVRLGGAIVSSDPQAILAHTISFFEREILADPASWAFLADKRWRRMLRRAAETHARNREQATRRQLTPKKYGGTLRP